MTTIQYLVTKSNNILVSIPKIILILVPLVILFFILFDMNMKEGLEDYDATDLDVTYNNSESYDLSNINYFNDNQYYNTANATTYTNSNYVPTYEDTVYLTRSSLISNSKPIYDSPSALGGFCSYTSTDKPKREEICNKIDKEVCASTECCVLLGGDKCVAGDSNGPLMTSNYNDPELHNKDHYYFNGKCFGNCINPTKY